MTAEDAQKLRPGDIVEHDTLNNYWIAKLVGLHGTHWTAVSNAQGAFVTLLPECPENFSLVGHSDSIFHTHTRRPL